MKIALKCLVVLLLCTPLCGILTSCNFGTNDTGANTTSTTISDGTYSYRKGMEWGTLQIRGSQWQAQGIMDMFGEITEFYYTGKISNGDLIITTKLQGYGHPGGVFGSVVNGHVESGGWIFK